MRNRLVALVFGLFLAHLASAQSIGTRIPSFPTPARQVSMLQEAGKRVVLAIKRGDTRTLSSIVDDSGITLGTDNPPISASAFRRELREKRGAYCDLLGCGHNVSALRVLLSRTPNNFVRTSLSKDFPNTGQADVVGGTTGSDSTGAQRSPLFTLFFILRGDEWRLQQIEYI